MPFPSTLSSFNRPATTDRLNSPSHSALHNTVSSAVGQIEQVIGLSTTSVAGSLFYDIRSPDSNGGGHIQTANKGGTGQTAYTKGDLLVATSPSVVSKLAVSSTLNDVLVADPAQAAGIKWATNPNSNKVAINLSSVIVSGTVAQTIFAASIAGSTLGESNGLRFRGEVRQFGSQDNFTLTMKYGENSVLTQLAANSANTSLLSGFIEGALMSNASSVLQLGYLNMTLKPNGMDNAYAAHIFKSGSSSVNSSAAKELLIQANYAGTNPLSSLTTGTFIVEKIS